LAGADAQKYGCAIHACVLMTRTYVSPGNTHTHLLLNAKNPARIFCFASGLSIDNVRRRPRPSEPSAYWCPPRQGVVPRSGLL